MREEGLAREEVSRISIWKEPDTKGEQKPGMPDNIPSATLDARGKLVSLPARITVLAMYMVFPLVGLFGLTLLISFFTGGRLLLDINESGGYKEVLLAFSLPMLIAMGLLPVAVKIKGEGRKREDLGIQTGIGRRTLPFILLFSGLILYTAYLLFVKDLSIGYDPRAVFIQFLVVGVAEELYMRSVILDELLKFMPLLAAALVSSLLFAFFLHSDASFWVNLLVRFPLGLFLVWLRIYTRSIYPAMVAHAAYDLAISTIPLYFNW